MEKRICNNCIGERFLSKLVEKTGKRKKCSYCEATGKTITILELADRTQTVFEQFYERTPENPDNYEMALLADKESDYTWYREGQETGELIEEVANIPSDAAGDVQSILEERFSDRESDEMGEETEFDSDAMYEFVRVGSKVWEERWHEFENSLKTDTRFFNEIGKKYLDDVFKNLSKLSFDGTNPIVLAGPGYAVKFVYRARVFLSEETLREALFEVVAHLGTPLSKFAKAGRMNATGISVFYGATDAATALAEVRPPVGSRVTVAKFKVIREVRLLNLIELQNIRLKGSLFDETHADLLSRVEFLKQLCDMMTIPVMPGEEEEYLVTQAIADYLSMDGSNNLDGIIFPSIQTEGSNIVLFHKASRVAKRDIPAGTEVSVRLWEHSEEGAYPSFTVSEETPREPLTEPSVEMDKDARSVSLAIDERNIKIHIIKGVQFTTDPHKLYFDRSEKVDYDEIEKRLGFGGHTLIE